MINGTDHPVAWALLLYEIDDLREHAESLVRKMASEGWIDDDEFRIHIGHLYAHLNLIWNGRDEGSEDVNLEQRDRLKQFPTDIEPVG